MVGVVGESGTEGQSSERLSSHGSWLIFPSFVMMRRGARQTGSHSNEKSPEDPMQRETSIKSDMETLERHQ